MLGLEQWASAGLELFDCRSPKANGVYQIGSDCDSSGLFFNYNKTNGLDDRCGGELEENV
jgi:hypothetical protein